MDILYHILIIVLLAVFFFIDKYTTSTNPMFFVIIISIIGFIFLQVSTIDYVDYSAISKVNTTYYENPKVELNDMGLGIFTVESFILLTYWFFLILGVLNMMLGKKESNLRK